MFAYVKEVGKFRFVFVFLNMSDVQFGLDGRAINYVWSITMASCSKKKNDNWRDAAYLENCFPSIHTLSEPVPVSQWVNVSQHLLSPQDNTPRFI